MVLLKKIAGSSQKNLDKGRELWYYRLDYKKLAHRCAERARLSAAWEISYMFSGRGKQGWHSIAVSRVGHIPLPKETLLSGYGQEAARQKLTNFKPRCFLLDTETTGSAGGGPCKSFSFKHRAKQATNPKAVKIT